MRRLPLLALMLGLVSCLSDPGDPDRRAGGSAVEGETVTARIKAPDGASLHGVTISVFDDLTGRGLQQVVTDSVGACTIAVPPGIDRLRLELEDPRSPGERIVFVLIIRPGLDTTLVSERWSSLEGTLADLDGWTSATVLQRELGKEASVESGRFTLAQLPPGTWDFTLLADSADQRRLFDLGTATIPSGGTTIQKRFSVRAHPLVAVEFEDSASLLVASCEGANLARGDRSCLDTASGEAAWNGTSLRATLPGTSSTPRAVSLLVASPPSTSLAVSAMDTLSFLLRGTGTLEIQLVSDSSGTPPPGGASGAVVASPGWTRVDIPTRRLLAPGSDTVQVERVTLKSSAPAWIVVDHLQILGSRP